MMQHVVTKMTPNRGLPVRLDYALLQIHRRRPTYVIMRTESGAADVDSANSICNGDILNEQAGIILSDATAICR